MFINQTANITDSLSVLNKASSNSYVIYIIYTEVIIMPNGMHSHRFMGITTRNDDHIHGYSGITSINPDIPGHIHYITGQTTFEDGHIHRYSLQTGPSIPVNGGHTHYYQAATSFEDGHIHYLYGYTSIYNQ